MIYIYKIFCKDENIEDVYIGSTTDIKKRITDHKYNCNNENSKDYNQYKYTFIRENGGFKNWTHDIICECTSEDRYKMERWYVENTKDTNLNKHIPNRSKKESQKKWYELNKDKIKDQSKKYRENNKKHNCECGGKYENSHKVRHFKTKKHQRFISSTEVVVKT